jgi:GntR family transcriptional regulator
MVAALNLVAQERGRSRYAVVADALRSRLLRGEWPPGVALPAEHRLASEHGVALGTMRQALQMLVSDGLIERIHGRGTFVRGGLKGASMLRFFRFGSESGEIPVTRILARRRCVAPTDVARRLGPGDGDEVLHLVRLRSLGGAPCLLENLWLPLPTFAAMADGPTDRWGDLLYPLYAERCGVLVHRAVDEIGFAALAVPQARHLALPPGHPCALVTRSAFDMAGRCVEVRTTRGDAHAFRYTVTLT